MGRKVFNMYGFRETRLVFWYFILNIDGIRAKITTNSEKFEFCVAISDRHFISLLLLLDLFTRVVFQ
jgi:hypothetical protein